MALGHERATIVGQSFGGGVAMQLAYQHPERCERLVLVASGGLGQEVALLLRALTLPGAEHLMPIACNGRVRDAGTAVTGLLDRIGLAPGPCSRGDVAQLRVAQRRGHSRGVPHTLRSVVDMHGQRVSATDRSTSPRPSRRSSCGVTGTRSSRSQHGIDAHEMIPGSRFEIFEGAGHFPHCEQPDRFVEVLVDFVDSTSPMAKSELGR